MATYDPNKAATFNQLRQQGLSEEAAAAQAGITEAESGNYTIGLNGQMGPVIAGTGRATTPLTAADRAESARFEAGLTSPSNFEQVDFSQTANSQPGTTRPVTYTTTSTETVSGGGTRTVTAGERQPTAASTALGAAYDAKNAEYNEFVKNNPSNFQRRRLGLPLMGEQEQAAYNQRLQSLNQEKEQLKNAQIDAEAGGTPTVTFTPNTTTTTVNTVTTTVAPQAAQNSLNPQNDEAVFRQTEAQIGSSTPALPTSVPAPDPTAPAVGRVEVGSVVYRPQPAQPLPVPGANQLVGPPVPTPAESADPDLQPNVPVLGPRTISAAPVAQTPAAESTVAAPTTPVATPVTLPDVPALGSQAGPSLLNPPPLAPGEEPVFVQRQIDAAAGENILTVNAQAAPDPYGAALAGGAGEQAFFAAAVDPTQDDFQQELANLRQAQENENIRYRADNLPVPDDFEDTFDQNPPVVDVGEIGDEDPEVEALLEQQRAIARADIANAYREPEPVPPSLAGIQVSRDDEGNLLPGWAYDENQGDYYIGDNFVDPGVAASAAESRAAAATKAKLNNAQQQATIQQRLNQTTQGDWRVKLSLAPGSQYLYNASKDAKDILWPLKSTNGVIFPYMPQIQTNYQAKYDNYELIHSNYRGYFYRSSQVGDINITGTFTAQDTLEAQYLLAVIHFFRSVTKMFYGQDTERGAPPPLCYLSGLGEYQFNNHPVLVSQFSYNLPSEVDYIRVTPNNQGLNMSPNQQNVNSSPLSSISSVINRLANAGLPKNAKPSTSIDLGVIASTVSGTGRSTYVPTKIDIQLTLLPVNTRKQVSQEFSLKNFANGSLLSKGYW